MSGFKRYSYEVPGPSYSQLEREEALDKADKAFEKAYAAHTKGFPIHSIGDDRHEFSWRPCDTCGSRLGGARTVCTLLAPGHRSDESQVLSCDDCVQYAANGTLPSESDSEWSQGGRR